MEQKNHIIMSNKNIIFFLALKLPACDIFEYRIIKV